MVQLFAQLPGAVGSLLLRITILWAGGPAVVTGRKCQGCSVGGRGRGLKSSPGTSHPLASSWPWGGRLHASCELSCPGEPSPRGFHLRAILSGCPLPRCPQLGCPPTRHSAGERPSPCVLGWPAVRAHVCVCGGRNVVHDCPLWHVSLGLGAVGICASHFVGPHWAGSGLPPTPGPLSSDPGWDRPPLPGQT